MLEGSVWSEVCEGGKTGGDSQSRGREPAHGPQSLWGTEEATPPPGEPLSAAKVTFYLFTNLTIISRVIVQVSHVILDIRGVTEKTNEVSMWMLH